MNLRQTWVAICLLGLGLCSSAPAMSVDEALELSKKTGRPLFAMVGGKNCGACIAMEKELKSSAVIGPVLSQYVALKIDQESPEWQKFATMYKHEGNTIPIIYVIRADGQQMYGQSAGGLSGNSLANFLGEQLSQAGTILNDQALGKMTDAVAKAKQLQADGHEGQAVLALAPFLGTGSFAAAAVEAEALGTELTQAGETRLNDAADQVLGGEDSLAAAADFLAAQRQFGRLPALKTKFVAKLRELNGDPAAKDALRQAGAFDKAAELAEKGNTKRAADAYRKIATQHPDTPAAELAQAKLAELGAESAEASGGDKPAATAVSAADQKKAASYLRMAKQFIEKRPEKAREYLDKVVELAPDTELAAEANQLLEGLN